MTKYSLGNNEMTRKLRLCACALCFFLNSACAGSIMEPGIEVPADQPCEETNTQPSSVKQDNKFVNYTDVAADYREYGERAPRDQLVVQTDAGSNLSAAVPPSIEDEVVEYEEFSSGVDGKTKDITVIEETTGSEEKSQSYNGEDPVEDWLAEEGRTLKDLLTEWSDRSGWRLIWNSNRNYTLTAGAMFRGRFADVSSALIRAFGRARPAPIGTFYKGNRVLVVETLEDENAYE